MSYLVNLDLRGKRAVVVGAGAVAARKIRALLAAGVEVIAVAPHACDEVRLLAEQERLSLRLGTYEVNDLDGAFLVIAASDDEALNAAISRDATERSILVNVVDRPALCTFTLPATVRRGDLTIALATEGRCPAMARALREELEDRYGEEYGAALKLMGKLRDTMIRLGWDSSTIQRVLSQLYQDGIVKKMHARSSDELAAFLKRRLGEEFPFE
jgi:precorrin-2 dehydrogenase/sirohydrochlorin ferrochelatase